jgi:signal transduction histidine kinase
MGDTGAAGRRPWPLRRRLTLAVTSVSALVLAATGGLVYGQFRQGLDERTDTELAERADALRALAASVPAGRVLGLSGEPLAQIYGPTGGLLETTGGLRGTRLLDPARARTATMTVVTAVRPVPRSDDGARVRAIPIAAGQAIAIAEPRDRREQELQQLATLLGIAFPGALLLSALIGYQVAGAALRPVERIRSRAALIGATDLGERLPEPGTRDELDRLTNTLNDLLDRLADALERQRRVVSDASHELRTPISVLRTRIDVALRGEPDPRRHHTALREARTDVQRLARLADDLLVLARADQGRLPLRLEPLDVQDVIEQAAGRHQPEAMAARRALSTAVEISGGAVVLADPDRLAQALDNLLVNALRYGAGAVSLRARPGEGHTVALVVSDDGSGFPTDLLPRAFERFAQGDQAARDAGSGLGLAIVEAIARGHGGTVGAANDPAGGARVTLRLPLA